MKLRRTKKLCHLWATLYSEREREFTFAKNGQNCCHESCSFSFLVQITKIVSRLELCPAHCGSLHRYRDFLTGSGAGPGIGRKRKGDEEGKEEEGREGS